MLYFLLTLFAIFYLGSDFGGEGASFSHSLFMTGFILLVMAIMAAPFLFFGFVFIYALGH